MKANLKSKIEYISSQYGYEEVFNMLNMERFEGIRDFVLDTVRKYRPDTQIVSSCTGKFLVDGIPLIDILGYETLVDELYDFLLFNQDY